MQLQGVRGELVCHLVNIRRIDKFMCNFIFPRVNQRNGCIHRDFQHEVDSEQLFYASI